MPQFSIVTVVKDDLAGIKKTLKSVFSQNYSDYNLIIIDGCSIDGTSQEIAKHQNRVFKHIREKDTGIYNAMNKAADYIETPWVFFLNAGDVFMSNETLEKVSKKLNPNLGLIIGNVSYAFKGYSKIIKIKKTLNPFKAVIGHHQGTFIRSTIFKKYKYDESFQVRADQDFFLKAYFNKEKVKYIDDVIARFDSTGISSKLNINHFQEGMRLGAKRIRFYKIFFPLNYWLILFPRYLLRNIFPEALLKIIRKSRV